jgi:hypothetical protein
MRGLSLVARHLRRTLRCPAYEMHLPLSRSTKQFPHSPHAQIARRANLPHPSALALSGKSQRSSRASRLVEEGRFGRSSRHVGRGCDGRGWHVRRARRTRTVKSRGPGTPWLVPSWRQCLRIAPMTVTKRSWTPGRTRISRKPSHRECRLIRLNLW